jgi:hypothetical protein
LASAANRQNRAALNKIADVLANPKFAQRHRGFGTLVT